MRTVGLACLGAAALIGLTACQSTLAPQSAATGATYTAASASGTPSPAAEAAPGEPLLPKNYRQLLAVALLAQYAEDASGPAEISQPKPALISFGPKMLMTVRFPVKYEKARKILFLHGPNDTFTRCLDVSADKGLFTTNKYFHIKWPKHDSERPCAGGVAFEPFPELDAMAAKVRACRERGEARCTLVDPEAEAKNAKTEPRRSAKAGH